MYSEKTLTLLFIIGFLWGCGNSSQNDRKEIPVQTQNSLMWYDESASDWSEALPLGNGRLGAMVFGGVKRERIQLNEESLWAGEKFESAPDDFYQNFQLVQKLVLNGKNKKADSLGRKLLTKKPTSFRSYEPLCNLYIEMDHDSIGYSDYSRELNLRDGIIRVSYKINGIKYKRKYLLSAEDDVLAIHLSSPKPQSISGKINISRWENAQITIREPKILNMQGQIIDQKDDPNDPNPGGSGPGGKHMKFAGRLAVMNQNGSVTPGDDFLELKNTDEVTILFSAATDYNLNLMEYDRAINPQSKTDSIIHKAKQKSWENIKDAHVREHRSLFERVTLDLGHSPFDSLPTDNRLDSLNAGIHDPGLMEQYFQFGRYLLMSSSRSPGILPPNLQGIWNQDHWAPWEADYHLDINFQMSYWPADKSNLFPTLEPLVGWIKKLSESGSVSAKKLYRSEGWVSFLATNPFGRTTPSASTLDSQFDNGVLDPLPGAWLAMALWRHYEYSQDKEFLREAYPILKGSALLIEDLLAEDDNNQLVIVPSTSPENQYKDPESGENLRITKGSTYHMSIARAIFNAVIESAGILNQDEDIRNRLIRMKEKFPPFKIGKNGTLQEWIYDYEEPEPGHRHFSHLLALYPFSLITSDQPALFKAAEKALKRRADHIGKSGAPGFSSAHLACAYTRFGKGDQALNYLNKLLTENTWDNLFTHVGSLLIDANCGGSTAISGMLLKSNNQGEEGNYIVHLLPALPTGWKEGRVQGLPAKGGYEVDLAWEKGSLTSAKIKSKKEGVLKLKYQEDTMRYQVNAGEEIMFQPG